MPSPSLSTIQDFSFSCFIFVQFLCFGICRRKNSKVPAAISLFYLAHGDFFFIFFFPPLQKVYEVQTFFNLKEFSTVAYLSTHLAAHCVNTWSHGIFHLILSIFKSQHSAEQPRPVNYPEKTL